jgi:hypothetical protein
MITIIIVHPQSLVQTEAVHEHRHKTEVPDATTPERWPLAGDLLRPGFRLPPAAVVDQDGIDRRRQHTFPTPPTNSGWIPCGNPTTRSRTCR